MMRRPPRSSLALSSAASDVYKSQPIPTPAGVISDTFTGRFNGQDVDLNRNWDCNWQPTGIWRDQVVNAGRSVFSEPETLALRDFFLAQPVAVSYTHLTLPTSDLV